MKNLIFTFLCLILTFSANSQEQTLINNASVRGGFGSFFTGVGDLNGQEAVSAGGGGGVVINNFFIGGFGEGVTQVDPFLLDGEDYDLSMGYGGLWLGFMYPSNSLFHMYASGKVAYGGVVLQPENDDFDLNEFDTGIFVMHPELGLELNVTSWFRLAFTAGYRIVNNVKDIPNINEDELTDFTYGLTFRFGHFW